MIADSLSTWLGFLTSPAAPKGVMSPMELDGYLTGIVVSPDLLPPSRWIDGIWGENEPTFDGLDQMQTVIAAVMDHYNAITAALDAGFKQIEAKKHADYRPLFLAASDKPNHDIVRTWVRGFGKAMALAPERWSSIAEDERLQPLLTPFIGFLDVTDPDFEPADNIDELLDEAATAIPRSTIVLRKIAQFSTGPPSAGAAKSAAMIQATTVQVSNTSDAAAQPKPKTHRGPQRMISPLRLHRCNRRVN
jgi:uncharacterized protein